MLTVDRLNVFYENVHVLHDVSIRIGAHEIVTLIGANGAGKTTLLNTISGLIPSASGRIEFDGNAIDALLPEQIVARGLTHIPEGRKIFPGLTVYENLWVGASARLNQDMKKADVAQDLEQIFAFFPWLKERQNQLGWTLSGGEQQMLALARGLMNRPRLLLLDEPSLGLSPRLTNEVFAMIRRINQEKGTPILLVEQNASMALDLAERGYVLQTGRIALEDSAENLVKSEAVRRAYLGG